MVYSPYPTFIALIWAEKITSSNLSDRTNSGGAVMSQLPYWGASSNTPLHGSYMNVTPFNHRHSTSIINYAQYSALNTFPLTLSAVLLVSV